MTSFEDPQSKFAFQFESAEQLIHNDADPTSGISVEVSFDGVNVHGRLQCNGPSKVVNWSVRTSSGTTLTGTTNDILFDGTAYSYVNQRAAPGKGYLSATSGARIYEP